MVIAYKLYILASSYAKILQTKENLNSYGASEYNQPLHNYVI